MTLTHVWRVRFAGAWLALLICTIAFAETKPSIGVVATPDGSLCQSVTQALNAAGLTTKPVSLDDLGNAAAVNRQRFDCLVFPDARRLPAAARKNFTQYLKAGGNIVLMHGPAFADLLWKYHDKWLTTSAVWDEIVAGATARHTWFNFDDGNLSGWKRRTNHPELHVPLTADNGHTGRCLRIDAPPMDAWTYEVFDAKIATPVAAGQNLFVFWAKATGGAPTMLVEVRDADGARWLAKLSPGPDWHRYSLLPSDFSLNPDNSPLDRGKPGDHLHLDKAALVSFGFATGPRRSLSPCTLWVDDVSTTAVALPNDFNPQAKFDFDEAFSTINQYQMPDIRSVAPVEGAILPTTGSVLNGRYDGISAIGFDLPDQSRFFPLLTARDEHGRGIGWAAGMLVQYDGPYSGSRWLLYGIDSPEFYRQPSVLATLAGFVRNMLSPALLQQVKAEAAKRQAESLPLSAPAPHGFVHRTEDGKHLLDPSGKRLFLIGCDYTGSFSRRLNSFYSGKWFDAKTLDADFKKAHDAGINAMRVYGFGNADTCRNVAAVSALRQCARKYGIYLLIEMEGNGWARFRKADIADIMAGHRVVANAFKDEPMLLGYDLENEPSPGEIASILFHGKPSALAQFGAQPQVAKSVDPKWLDQCVRDRPGWSDVGKWVSAENARGIYVGLNLWERYCEWAKLGTKYGYSTFPGVKGPLPSNEEWKGELDAMSATYAEWIKYQIQAIRAVNPHHLITVGYNRVLSCLPANEQLDFLSEHCYQPPLSKDDVLLDLTTMDRLASVWPNKPVTLGEFGYANEQIINNKVLDFYTAAVGEFMHYLYSWSHGYDGCMKWELDDATLAYERRYTPWMNSRPDADTARRMKFGMFWYDGTLSGRPKPIIFALRFLRRYLDTGDPRGQLQLDSADNLIGTGYTYEAPHALFVGNTDYQSSRLTFHATHPANVLLCWDAQHLDIMATADAHVELDPTAFVPGLSSAKVTVTGKCAHTTTKGPRLALDLLEGEPVTLH